MEAVVGLFKCSGLEAAQALSQSFVKQWGPRMLPWLELPFYIAFKDAVASCVTSEQNLLPLLDVFGTWFRPDFVQEPRVRELAAELLSRCTSAGFDGKSNPHVERFLQRLGPSPDASATAVVGAIVPSFAGMPGAAVDSATHCEFAAAPGNDAASAATPAAAT